jgi:leader peptidase (prepilin peptidase) / N-methyltransferase
LDTVLSAAFWQLHPGFFVGAVIGLALIVGSFLNVVILRLPAMMEHAWRREARELLESDTVFASNTGGSTVSLSHPPSTCPQCGHLIRPWENVPVLSYVLLRGRCSQCRKRISPRYPVIEAVTALLSAAVALHFGASWLTAALLLFTWALIALTVIDMDHQLLPDNITLPLLWLGLLINSQGLIVPLEQAVFGAMFGYLSLWCVYWGFKLLTGKDGMGYGDFKLLAALGAWLGWQALPVIIILSSLVGAIVGGALILLLGRDKNVPIPFGPYLAAAGWLAALFGDDLTQTYLRITGL